MIDILVYLFQNFGDFDAQPEAEILTRRLAAAGFEHDEISDALDWIAGLKAAIAALPDGGPGRSSALRIFTHEEQSVLGCDGLGFICFLEANSLLRPFQRELIIDRVLALGEPRVSLSKLKIVALIVLWSQEADLDAFIIDELLSGPEPLLH